MKIKVWNLEEAPFPREGLNPLEPSENCMVSMLLKREAAKFTRLSQFDAPENEAELKVFQTELRAKIWEKFGTVYDGTLPLDTTIYGKIQYDGYSVTKLTYQSVPGVHVTALLYVPDGDGPFPAVVNMHGHYASGKFGLAIQQTALALVKSGYVCLSVDAFGVYERATTCQTLEYHGSVLGNSMLNLGQTMMGAQVVDNMRAVDLLQSLPCVIKDRIGAAGASGGGNQTMWLSAMDERIAAAMPVVSVGSFESYVSGINCVCELLIDGLTFTDEAGILALIAPRPLNIGNSLFDVNKTFSVAEMLKTYHLVETLYWNLGKHDFLTYTIANRVHGMTDEHREAMLGWFDLHLKGIGGGRPRPEPDYEIPPEKELYVLDPENRPETVCSTVSYCLKAGTELREKMLAAESFNKQEKLKELQNMLRLKTLPAEMNLTRYKTLKGFERMALESGDHLIPIVMKTGSCPGKFRLLLSPDGKNTLSDEQIARCGADGATVVMFDLFSSGETAERNDIAGKFHQPVRQLLWLGRSLPGEWVFDILSVCRMLRESFAAESIDIEAEREAAWCSLFAAALTDDLTLKAVDMPGSFLFRTVLKIFKNDPAKGMLENFLYSPMQAIPGFLKWGDISLAIALAGQDRITLSAPRMFDGTPLNDADCAALTAEISALSAKIR